MLSDGKLKSIIAAFDQIDCGIAIYGPKFELLYINENAARNVPVLVAHLRAGHAMHDAVRANVRDVLPGADEATLETHTTLFMQKILSGEEVEFRSSDDRIIRAFHAPMLGGGYIGITTDVTELRRGAIALKKARQEAEIANDAKSRFLATMSHEVRTPMSGVLGMAQALARRPLPPYEQEMVATIVESSRAVLTILNDVLDLSRIEAGAIGIRPVAADLRQLLGEVERLHRPCAQAKGLDFRIAIAPSVPARLRFDPGRIRQCLINLVSNAIKFTDDGAVHIAAMAEPIGEGQVAVTIHVRDTGIGIDSDTLDKLFEAFVQADRSAARSYGGTGLGLAITRELLTAMGGHVGAVSTLGEGSVFSMTFPAAIADGVGSSPSEGGCLASSRITADGLNGLRVLLVDDDRVTRQVTRALLAPFGAETHEVASGPAALHALQQDVFDLVLLDIHMPRMDGIDTFHDIRSSGQSWAMTPVIAVTADAMRSGRAHYLAMGMEGYVAKPIEEDALLAEITAVLKGSRNQRPHQRAS